MYWEWKINLQRKCYGKLKLKLPLLYCVSYSFYSLTIDNSNHSPQSKDDKERHCLKRFFLYPGMCGRRGRRGGGGGWILPTYLLLLSYWCVCWWPSEKPYMPEYIHIQFTHTYSDAMSRAKDMTTTIPSNTSNLCVKYFIRNAISFNRTCEVRARSHDKRLL